MNPTTARSYRIGHPLDPEASMFTPFPGWFTVATLSSGIPFSPSWHWIMPPMADGLPEPREIEAIERAALALAVGPDLARALREEIELRRQTAAWLPERSALDDSRLLLGVNSVKAAENGDPMELRIPGARCALILPEQLRAGSGPDADPPIVRAMRAMTEAAFAPGLGIHPMDRDAGEDRLVNFAKLRARAVARLLGPA